MSFTVCCVTRARGLWKTPCVIHFDGRRHRGESPTVVFSYGVVNDDIWIGWSFSGLTDEFYTAAETGFRATDGGSSREIAHTGPLRSLIYGFQKLATQIFWSSAMQMDIYPLNPVSEEDLQPDPEDGPEELRLSYCYQLEAAPHTEAQTGPAHLFKDSLPPRSVIDRLREWLDA